MTRPPAAAALDAPGPLRAPKLLLAALAVVGALLAAFAFAAPYANPDAHAFEALARALLSGHGLRYREPMLPWLDLLAFRSPGYPVFLAPLLAAGGVRLALAANGALVVFLAAQAGEIVARAATRRAGWITFALVLAWPMAWAMAGRLMSELLFAALAAMALRAALASARVRSLPLAAAAGVLAAAATLTRPVGAAVALGVLVALARRSPRLALAALLALGIAYAPWPARNLRVLHAPVAFTTNSGFNLCDGAVPEGTAAMWTEMSGWTGVGELELDARWRARWRAEVTAHPARQAKRSLVQFVHALVPLERSPVQALHRLVAFLALAGLALGGTSPAGAALAIAWLGQGAINALAQVNERYRFPGEWLAACFAGVAVAELIRRLGPVRARVAVAALAGLGALTWLAQVIARPR